MFKTSSLLGLIAVFLLVLVPLFTVGLYFFSKRFWPQDRHHSRTAPPSPRDGLDNKLHDHDKHWRPPRAS